MRPFKFFTRKKVEAEIQDLLSPAIRNQIHHQRGNVNDIFPSDFTADERENMHRVKDYTMSSYERLLSLSKAIEYIEENMVEGDIVECGVWKGGSMMMAALKLKEMGNVSRQLFLFDTYEGMSEPSKEDKAIDGSYASELLSIADKEGGDNIWCVANLEQVKTNLYSTNYDRNKMHFIVGKVEDTLPHPAINKIAILRLDTDWYESTLHELDMLYDKVVPGGIIIIDDYGHWAGSKKAVDEFIKNRKLKVFLNRIDYTARLIVKADR